MYINERRDKALAEARGEEYLDRMGKSIEDTIQMFREQDTSTWDGFGALLRWSREQDWWSDFIEENGMVIKKTVEGEDEPTVFEYFPVNLLDAEEFADAIIAYLDDLSEQKEKELEEAEEEQSPKPNAVMGSCNGSIWSNCKKSKCNHYLSHDIGTCKSHYCHDIKRMVWCTPVRNAVTESQLSLPKNGNGDNTTDVWKT